MDKIIVGSNGITGNIGVCESKSINIITKEGIIVRDVTTRVTNSCTGQIQDFPTWSLTEFGAICSILFSLVILIFAIKKITD